ncbi:DUF6236 family protein [Kitasatospora sp. NPDC085879]|uniref:DUF6236 family protein n=1 Tax=Kitasatospora sp. NPDC085879 TaxID=3154769 RepID=UPI003422252B
MLQQIGLYYPYIHFRDEEWLKAAALYWPKLARVVPNDYPVADSGTAHALAEELDFIVPVDPAMTASAVRPMFLEALERHGAEFQRYQVENSGRGVEVEPTLWTSSRRDYQLAGLYRDEVDDELRTALLERRLAVETRRNSLEQDHSHAWVAMDPRLAWVYKCAFVEALARNGRLTPTTDQKEAHLQWDGWDADAIAQRLGADTHPVPDASVVESVGLLAVRTVVPANLADVPVSKIIKVRQRHGSEFEAFSAAVNEAVAILQSELAEVTVPEALALYAQLEVEHRFTLPLDNLRRAMKGLGIETAFSAANLKFDLPAVASSVAGGFFAGLPVVGAALGAVLGIAGISRTAAQRHRAVLADSPAAAYLLSIEGGLEPRSLLQRLGLQASDRQQ